MTQTNPPRRILLGHIASAHGIRGEVLIKTHTGEPEAIAGYGPLEDEAGQKKFEISVVRVTPKGVIARVAGVTDRNAAEALARTALYVARELLPEPDAAEFYHADLIGMRVVSPDGSPLGEVVDVLNFGAGDILEIRREGASETELIPFTNACVPKVDLAARVVVIDVPAERAEEAE